MEWGFQPYFSQRDGSIINSTRKCVFYEESDAYEPGED